MTQCRNCGSDVTQFFSLGDMPLVNSFLQESELQTEKKFDLSVGFCKKCFLVQLMQTVDPEELFRNYIYFSSTSKTILEHNERESKYLAERLGLTADSLVLETASNDGALLQYFQKLGVKVLGVDPAKNIAEIANKKGIPTIAEFFGYSFAKKLVSEKKVKADLVYGANVLAHVPEILDFVKGVKTVLAESGTAVFESPYLKGLLENKFDTIYHEHVFYYSVLALVNLFDAAGLEIYDVDFVNMQGGSFRIFASHKGVFAKTERLVQTLREEEESGYKKLATYEKMNTNVTNLKKDLLSLMAKLQKEGKKIAAYSAPAKGIILLNYFGIGNNYLDFIVDKAVEKQGLYTPGVHMKVYAPEKIMTDKPDYVLILCWNIAEEVMRQLSDFQKQGGKFIIPIPAIRVV